MSSQNMNPKRSSSLGCLGCLAIPVLGLMSVALVGLLWWLNPSWLDDHATWRAPLVTETCQLERFAEDEPSFLAQLGLDDDLEAPPGPTAWAPIERLELAKLVAAYDPQLGGEIREPNGLRLDVPAGALPRAGELTMTPILRLPSEMDASFIGPIYDLRLGDEEHLQFRRPATLSLPYLASSDASSPRLVVWENDRWVPVEASIDRTARTLTAEIEHASIWSVVTAAAQVPAAGAAATQIPTSVAVAAIGATLWAAANGTTRSIGKSVFWGFADGYETPEGNFQFHYERSTVPDDADYLAAVGTPRTQQPVPGVPLYVQDLGAWLEESRVGLEQLGLPLPSAKLVRYDVFLSPLKALGESGLGGPIVLTSDLLAKAAADKLPLADLMRSVCTHELTHVAQGGSALVLATVEYVMPKGYGPLRKWWLEMTAEYAANYFWEQAGRPLGVVTERYRKTGDLPSISMLGAADPDYYSYSSFLSWIDVHHGAGRSLSWIQALDSFWTANTSSIDAAARQAVGGRGLVQLFREFAFDCYHDDLFGGQRFPSFHTGVSDFGQAFSQGTYSDRRRLRRFLLLAREGDKGAGVKIDTRLRARPLTGIAPLSAQAAYVLFDGLPEDLHAKLVLHVENTSANAADVSLYLSMDDAAYQTIGGKSYQLPVTRALGQLERVEMTGPHGLVRVVEGLGAKGAPNRATLVAINEQLAGGMGSLHLERWLLLPPESVQYERRAGSESEWVLDWPSVDLQADAGAFETYRVFRKPAGSEEDLYEAVLDTTTPSAVVVAQPGRDWLFTVRTVDVLGNESANAPSLDLSFAGSWSGKLRLVKGSLLDPLLGWAERRIADGSASAKAEIAAEGDPARRAELQAKLDADLADLAEMLEAAKPYLEAWAKGEAAFRAGVPISFEIREAGAGYEVRLTSVLGLDPEMTEWLPVERLSRDRIGATSLEGLGKLDALSKLEMSPPVLRMHRFDPTGKRPAVIRTDDWSFAIPIEPDGMVEVHLAWEFTRKP